MKNDRLIQSECKRGSRSSTKSLRLKPRPSGPEASSGYSGPIVALTAHSMPEERDRCLAIGCDEFQGKPVNRDMLLEAVRRLATRGTGASRSE